MVSLGNQSRTSGFSTSFCMFTTGNFRFRRQQDTLVDTLVDRGDVGDDSGADARLLSGARSMAIHGMSSIAIGMIHGLMMIEFKMILI